MQCCETTFVPRVHGHQNIEGFGTATFSYDNSIGSHSEGVSNQISRGESLRLFAEWCLGFKSHPVFKLDLKFKGVFYRNHSFVGTHKSRKRIEQRGFSATRPAQKGKDFALSDGQGNILDRLKYPEAFRYAFDPQERFFQFNRPS